ncbi:MAG: accessory gene regulator B family protein [Syntrophomonadaceae bacterium]|nr:accessory gene regulator B family protein [Syntrophomonadaceae bacterium]MDH7498419.1 accessory gene regulator B family protein [Syntrophomonadaceae bacterium]
MVAYGLEILLDGLSQVAVVLAIAWAAGVLAETALVMAVAMAYRRVSGGVHCTAYSRCLVLSAAVFPLLGRAVQACGGLPQLAAWRWAGMAAATAIALAWAPAGSPVRPLPEGDRRRGLRARSLLALSAAVFALLLAPAPAGTWWADALVVGMLWQSFTLTPLGFRFIGQVDRWLGFLFVPGKEG